MIEEERRDVELLLREVEVFSGEIDASTSERLRNRLATVMGPQIADGSDTDDERPPMPLRSVPIPAEAADPDALPGYADGDVTRSRRKLRAVFAVAGLVAATVITVAVISGPERQDPGPDLALPAVVAPMLAAPDLRLSDRETMASTVTVRDAGTSRRREIRADGSGFETVFALDGSVLFDRTERPPGSMLFGGFTYTELRALPTDPAVLASSIAVDSRTETLVELAALPATPPSVRAAAIEALTAAGFAWHLEESGFVAGTRGSGPQEVILIDPAAGRATAHGWLDDPTASLLDSERVTTWQ